MTSGGVARAGELATSTKVRSFKRAFPTFSIIFFLRFSPDFSDNEKVVGCGFYEK